MTLLLQVRRLMLQSASQTATPSASPDASASPAPRPWYIYRVAGTGVQGDSGNGGSALSARLSTPYGGCSDGDGGYLFVSLSLRWGWGLNLMLFYILSI